MLQSRNVSWVLACLAALGCASAPRGEPTQAAPPRAAEPPTPTPTTTPTTTPPTFAALEPAPEAAPPATPESPVVLRVSYGNLGTAAGSEWEVHSDGLIRGKVCDDPRERRVSEVEVTELRASMQRCKLCDLPERHPSGSNADKQIYRVHASWPDLSCTTDVSLQSRFHYDKRAQRCHDILEKLLQARVSICPDEELAP